MITKEAEKKNETGAFPSANNAFAFPTPFNAVHTDRGPVRVLAYGDIPGNSPSFLCVDGYGNAGWASLKDVTLIDPSCMPLQVSQLAGITAHYGQGQTGFTDDARRIVSDR